MPEENRGDKKSNRFFPCDKNGRIAKAIDTFRAAQMPPAKKPDQSGKGDKNREHMGDDWLNDWLTDLKY